MMKRFNWTVLCIALASMAAAPAPAAAETVLSPASPWGLSKTTEQCSLARQFGEGDAAVHLQLVSYGALSHVRMLVAGKGLTLPTSGKSFLRLRPDEQPREVERVLSSSTDDMTILNFDVRYASNSDAAKESDTKQRLAARRLWLQDQPAYETAATIVELELKNGSLELQTGEMHRPLSAMRECIASLHKEWGLDPAVQKDLLVSPKPGKKVMSRIIADLSTMHMADGQGVYIPTRVRVSATGKSSDCVVQSDWVPKAFVTNLCGVLSGKTMEPALDMNGQPVDSMLYLNHEIFE